MMGYEDGQMIMTADTVLGIKPEIPDEYPIYDNNDYVHPHDDNGHALVPVANQICSDAERLAQLEKEFHEQVNRLTNVLPELEVKNQHGMDMHGPAADDTIPSTVPPSVDETATSDKKPYPCPVCGKRFGRVSHVRRHQLLHTGDKPYECELCHERFTRQENRDRHMSIHTKQRPHKCSVCPKGFTQLNRLKMHMLGHAGDRPFVCQICYKAFLRVDHLRVHMKVHLKPDTFAGARCSAKSDAQPTAHAETAFGSGGGGRTSSTTSRSESSSSPPPPPPSPSPTSPLPKKRAISAAATPPPTPLPSHEHQSTDSPSDTLKPYPCPQCPKSFTRRDHFRRHILVHSGAKPYECDVCARSFSRKDNKYSHMVNCLLKNYGISLDHNWEDASKTTLESMVEASMEEIRRGMGHRAAYNDFSHISAFENDNECGEPQQWDEMPAHKAPPPAVEAGPVVAGTIRLRDLNELSSIPTTVLQLQQPNQLFAEADPSHFRMAAHLPHFTDDTTNEADTDFVDPSAFLSTDAEAYTDVDDTSTSPTSASPPTPSSAAAAALPSPNNGDSPSANQMPRYFKCDACDREFAHKSHLVRHSMLHTGDKPFKCDQCDKSFNRKEHLQRHVIVHTGIKPYKCLYCERSFYQLHQQVRHTQDEHDAEVALDGGRAAEEVGAFMDSGEAVQAADGMYHCDRCDKSYAIKFHLKRHYARHTGDKPFQCDLCEQRFSRSEYKRRHMAIHTNDRRYECEFCERRFMRADHMLAHVKTHEGVLPYKCNVCAVRFATSREKIEHARKHTGAYRCEMCLERFEMYADLCDHRRDIHLQTDTEKTAGEHHQILVGRHEHYPCPICKQYFSIVALGDHLKTHVMGDVADELPSPLQQEDAATGPQTAIKVEEFECGDSTLNVC